MTNPRQYLFPNKRLHIMKAGTEYLGQSKREAIKDWLARYQVPLIKVGKGEINNKYFVHLWDIMDGLEKEKEENQRFLCKPQSAKKPNRTVWY